MHVGAAIDLIYHLARQSGHAGANDCRATQYSRGYSASLAGTAVLVFELKQAVGLQHPGTFVVAAAGGRVIYIGARNHNCLVEFAVEAVGNFKIGELAYEIRHHEGCVRSIYQKFERIGHFIILII